MEDHWQADDLEKRIVIGGESSTICQSSAKEGSIKFVCALERP